MQLELQERDDVVVNSKKVGTLMPISYIAAKLMWGYLYNIQVGFQLPANMVTHNPHKDSVCRISHLSDGMMVTCSQVS